MLIMHARIYTPNAQLTHWQLVLKLCACVCRHTMTEKPTHILHLHANMSVCTFSWVCAFLYQHLKIAYSILLRRSAFLSVRVCDEGCAHLNACISSLVSVCELHLSKCCVISTLQSWCTARVPLTLRSAGFFSSGMLALIPGCGLRPALCQTPSLSLWLSVDIILQLGGWR